VIEYSGYEVPDLWKPYAAQYPDLKPRFNLIGTDDQATTRARAGVGDLGHPCVGVIEDWIKLDLVQPWDTSLISNFPDLNPGLVQAGIKDGQQYFIPLDWGFISTLYRSDQVDPGAEPSWNLLFDDRYKGKIAWYDSSQDMLAITGYTLGFENPFDMSDDELDQAKKFLISKKKNVRFIWSGQTDMEAQFAQGDIWITYAWPSSWVAMQKQKLKVDYLDPKEGRLAFLCGMMLLKNTENYYHAHDYANAWASPETGLWLINNYAYGHSNTKIDLTKVDPKLVEAFALEDPGTIAEPKVHVLRYIAKRKAYGAVWTEVKAA
jgi:spermidine/putrescine-binding protein